MSTLRWNSNCKYFRSVQDIRGLHQDPCRVSWLFIMMIKRLLMQYCYTILPPMKRHCLLSQDFRDISSQIFDFAFGKTNWLIDRRSKQAAATLVDVADNCHKWCNASSGVRFSQGLQLISLCMGTEQTSTSDAVLFQLMMFTVAFAKQLIFKQWKSSN